MIKAIFTDDVHTVTTEKLYQYDKGQQLQILNLGISGTIEVHFANLVMKEAVVKEVEVAENSNQFTIDIPNIFLENSGSFCKAWVYLPEGDSGRTIRTIYIPIEDRKKPEGFITPSDPATKTLLDKAIDVIENGATSVTDEQLAGAVESYFNENPPPLLTETDKADIARTVIESLGGNPVFGYVDENNNIIVSGKLASGSYYVKYEMEDGSTVDIGELVFSDNVLYSVTNNLTNCTNSNSTTQAIEGSNYTATISANSGYELSGVTVTMGGNPVTVSGGNINITNVTGDIVITAVAEESAVTPAYTNLADPTSEEWMDGYRISTSGVIEATEGVTLMNTIPCVKDDTIRVKGVTTVVVAMFDENGAIMGRSTINATNTQFGSIVVEGDYNQFTIAYSACKSIRFYGTLSTTAENVIITRNQAIE